MKTKRITYGMLVILWMIVVFCFSNQNGDESQNISDTFTYKVVNVVLDTTKKVYTEELKDTISFIIRKLAHFSIYFIGGILIYNFLFTFEMRKRNIILFTILFGILYAISDEIHQIFIDGRSSQVRDVLIDTSGVILAIVLLQKKKYQKFKRKKLIIWKIGKYNVLYGEYL